MITSFFKSIWNGIIDRKWILLKFAGYSFFVIIFYILFLWFLFPYNELVAKLTNSLGNSTTMEVSVKNAKGAFPIGLKLEDVTLIVTKGKKANHIFNAKQIILKPSIISIFKGWISLNTNASLYNGDVNMGFGLKKDKFYLNGVIKNISIGDYSVLKDMYGLNMNGTVNAKLDITGSLNNIQADNGNVFLSMRDVNLEPSTIMGILTIPKISFGEIKIPLFIKNGEVHIEDASQTSNDINSQLNGSIILGYPLVDSMLNIQLKFNPTPGTEKNIKNAVPIFMLKRDVTGYYNVSIKGNLNMPRFEQ
ncbi:MAG: type II secretion system protein GspN [Deltaproteobacteria bacterium]|nr:type II secretion system protein GspN [Deltaproteobacteria bacterium]MCL5791745.1 type II secretion system protein GspN [Deltaproteobacteria bacterium]